MSGGAAFAATAVPFVSPDFATGGALVDAILDEAEQKGTGRWTAQSALDLGVPVTAITEAVYARCISAVKDARVRASKVLSGPTAQTAGTAIGDKKAFIEAVRRKCCTFRSRP